MWPGAVKGPPGIIGNHPSADAQPHRDRALRPADRLAGVHVRPLIEVMVVTPRRGGTYSRSFFGRVLNWFALASCAPPRQRCPPAAPCGPGGNPRVRWRCAPRASRKGRCGAAGPITRRAAACPLTVPEPSPLGREPFNLATTSRLPFAPDMVSTQLP